MNLAVSVGENPASARVRDRSARISRSGANDGPSVSVTLPSRQACASFLTMLSHWLSSSGARNLGSGDALSLASQSSIRTVAASDMIAGRRDAGDLAIIVRNPIEAGRNYGIRQK